MKIKIAIALLGAITTVSINCSLIEKINASKEQLSELRAKALKGALSKTMIKCKVRGYNDCSTGKH